MTWIAIFIFAFTAVRIVVALINYVGKPWLKNIEPSEEALISVLIPARNEEKNIQRILESLIKQDYSNIEILVYDDLSEDQTASIVKDLSEHYSKIRYIQGVPLPIDWLGKNHACYKLSLHARGNYLLFLDADVNIGNGLMKNALAHVQKNNLALLSIFPVQEMYSLAERATVPLMNWILVSLLPLALTRLSNRKSLAAANGQFMFFDAEVYHRESYHETLKDHKVEDIAIFRLMKSRRLRVETLLSNKYPSCRMYHSWDEALSGFSKNVFEFFGGSRLFAILFGLITTFGFLFVLLGLPTVCLAVYFIMVISLRIMISLASKQNVLYNIILAPLQQITFLAVITRALILQNKKATQWKGRNIDQIIKEGEK